VSKTADDLQNVVEYLTTLAVGQSTTLGWHVTPENTGEVLRKVVLGELSTQDAKQIITNAVRTHYEHWLSHQGDAQDAIEIGVEDVLGDDGPVGF
jgi:hypothetical protein